VVCSPYRSPAGNVSPVGSANAGLLLAHGAAVVDDKGSIVLLKVEKTTKGVELKPIGGGS